MLCLFLCSSFTDKHILIAHAQLRSVRFYGFQPNSFRNVLFCGLISPSLYNGGQTKLRTLHLLLGGSFRVLFFFGGVITRVQWVQSEDMVLWSDAILVLIGFSDKEQYKCVMAFILSGSHSSCILHKSVQFIYCICVCDCIDCLLRCICVHWMCRHVLAHADILHCQRIAGNSTEWVGWNYSDVGMINNFPAEDGSR